MGTSVQTYPDTATLVAAAGDQLAEAISAAISARGIAWIVLTGGGTGIGLLSRVGTHPVDWSRVHLFWGDDRFVPRDDDERNEKQAREALLDHIEIPAGNIHPMPPSDGVFGNDLDAAAGGYQDMLAGHAETGSPTPVFDVHLLGMGVRLLAGLCLGASLEFPHPLLEFRLHLQGLCLSLCRELPLQGL